jgi:hypothetical protein
MLFHIAQRRFTLAHGTLTQHLAAEKKIDSFRSHPFPGQPEHEGMAVHTGIHVFAVSNGRVAQHGQVNLRDAFHPQRNARNAGGLTGFVG